MPRLPFAFASPSRRADLFDDALYYGATIAALAALLAAGASTGYLIALWLFN